MRYFFLLTAILATTFVAAHPTPATDYPAPVTNHLVTRDPFFLFNIAKTIGSKIAGAFHHKKKKGAEKGAEAANNQNQNNQNQNNGHHKREAEAGFVEITAREAYPEPEPEANPNKESERLKFGKAVVHGATEVGKAFAGNGNKKREAEAYPNKESERLKFGKAVVHGATEVGKAYAGNGNKRRDAEAYPEPIDLDPHKLTDREAFPEPNKDSERLKFGKAVVHGATEVGKAFAGNGNKRREAEALNLETNLLAKNVQGEN